MEVAPRPGKASHLILYDSYPDSRVRRVRRLPRTTWPRITCPLCLREALATSWTVKLHSCGKSWLKHRASEPRVAEGARPGIMGRPVFAKLPRRRTCSFLGECL